MSATRKEIGLANEDEKKPIIQSPHINLKVNGHGKDGNVVFFRIRRNAPLKKLVNAYCDSLSLEFNSIRFLFDGQRLQAEKTPDELEMEEGDEIDAMLPAEGGGI